MRLNFMAASPGKAASPFCERDEAEGGLTHFSINIATAEILKNLANVIEPPKASRRVD